MDQGQVTLLAALIAALASIISLLGDIFSTWSGELRATHRNALLPHLAELGSSIDLFVSACIKYGQQLESGVVNPAGLQEALDTVEKLNEVRTKVKYPLWGIDIGIETLSMLPFWLKDWGHDPYSQKRLVRDAVRLRMLLDEIIGVTAIGGG